MATRLKKKKTTAKKASTVSRRARSLAAKKGWITRRKRKAIKRQPPKRKRVIKRKRKSPPKRVEYAVNVNYRVKGQTNAISVQFSVMAAPGLSATEIENIIVETIANEGESPHGTRVRIIDWRGGRVPHEIPWDTLAIVAAEPHTKIRVSQNRSR